MAKLLEKNMQLTYLHFSIYIPYPYSNIGGNVDNEGARIISGIIEEHKELDHLCLSMYLTPTRFKNYIMNTIILHKKLRIIFLSK